MLYITQTSDIDHHFGAPEDGRFYKKKKTLSVLLWLKRYILIFRIYKPTIIIRKEGIFPK